MYVNGLVTLLMLSCVPPLVLVDDEKSVESGAKSAVLKYMRHFSDAAVSYK